MSFARSVLFIASAVALGAFVTTTAHADNAAVAKKIEAYVAKNNLQCMSCHAINHKVVGPAWIEVAERYHGKKGAAAMLAKNIANGNVGIWGQIPMPPGMATPAQAKVLAKLVLALDTKGKK